KTIVVVNDPATLKELERRERTRKKDPTPAAPKRSKTRKDPLEGLPRDKQGGYQYTASGGKPRWYYPSKGAPCDRCAAQNTSCRTTTEDVSKPMACLGCAKARAKCSLVDDGDVAEKPRKGAAGKAKSEAGGAGKRPAKDSKGKGKAVVGSAEKTAERSPAVEEVGSKEFVGVFVPPLSKATKLEAIRGATPGPSTKVLVLSTPAAALRMASEAVDAETPGGPPPRQSPRVVDLRGGDQEEFERQRAESSGKEYVPRNRLPGGEAEEDRGDEGISWEERERRHAEDRQKNAEHAYEVALQRLKWDRQCHFNADQNTTAAAAELREAVHKVYGAMGDVGNAQREMIEARHAAEKTSWRLLRR
ncbi:hypothetical protein BD410DRAFT_847201, partial [Rickenella mellea]